MVRNFTTPLLAHWCLALLASRRRGFSHPASSTTTGGPIRSRTAICPAGPASNPHRITNASEQAVRLVGRRNRTTMPSKNPLFKSVRVKPRSLSARTTSTAATIRD